MWPPPSGSGWLALSRSCGGSKETETQGLSMERNFCPSVTACPGSGGGAEADGGCGLVHGMHLLFVFICAFPVAGRPPLWLTWLRATRLRVIGLRPDFPRVSVGGFRKGPHARPTAHVPAQDSD